MSESPGMTAVERRAERIKTAIEKQARNVEIRRTIGQAIERIAIEREGRSIGRWPVGLTEKRLRDHPEIDRAVLARLDNGKDGYRLILEIARTKGAPAVGGVRVFIRFGLHKGSAPITAQAIREANPSFFPGPEVDGRLISAISLGKHVDWATEALAIEGRSAALQAEMATFGVKADKSLIHPEEEAAL